MLRVTKYREPVRGTALGKGPSAQAIEGLMKRLDKIPLLGSLIEDISVGNQGRVVLKGKPRKPQDIKVDEGIATGVATAGVLTGIINQQKEER